MKKRTKRVENIHRKEELISTLKQHLPELQERFGLRTMGLFGSFVHGKEGPSSDIDILAEFHRAPTLFEFARLQRQLSEIVRRELNLLMKSALKLATGKPILEENGVPMKRAREFQDHLRDMLDAAEKAERFAGEMN